jgi:D-alanine-D-alanine ligase
MNEEHEGFVQDWWRTLFDDLYLVTDARSVDNEQVTREEIDFVVEHLELSPGERILDLCGGQGRHCLELAQRGYPNVTVFDYSHTLLRLGAERAACTECGTAFCRGDARELGLADSAFDCVLVMGNSFGYFMEDKENSLILGEIARVLKPGGRVLLDLSNREYVVSRLVPVTWHEATEDVVVCRSRSLLDHGVLAREVVLSKKDGLLRDSHYYSRLFSPKHIGDLLAKEGFGSLCFAGDFRADKKDCTYGMMANRMIVTARLDG